MISETQSVFVYSMLRHHFQMVLDNIRIFATAMLRQKLPYLERVSC